MGKDLFGFSINPEGIFPWGGETTYINRFSHNANCKNVANSQAAESGFGCAKWVIERGNLKYMRENVSW